MRTARIPKPEREAMTLRSELEAVIEAAIATLDRLDGDADLEPLLGAPELGDTILGRLLDQRHWAQGFDAEETCEDEGGACEDEGAEDEREPELGAPEGGPGGASWALHGHNSGTGCDEHDGRSRADQVAGWKRGRGGGIDGHFLSYREPFVTYRGERIGLRRLHGFRAYRGRR